MGLLTELDEIAGALQWMGELAEMPEPQGFLLRVLAGRILASAEALDAMGASGIIPRKALEEETSLFLGSGVLYE